MTWQTIDTAPKDGTEIDLWCVTYELTDRQYGTVLKVGRRFPDARFKAETYDDWISTDGEMIQARGYRPTHWMLSPKPPGDA